MLPLERRPLELPQPDGWSAPEWVEDVIVADGISLFRAGIASTSKSGVEVTGSAADLEPSSVRRAGFELLERMATVEAIDRGEAELEMRGPDSERIGTTSRGAVFPDSDEPKRWRFARSNGIAIRRGWDAACAHARLELAERDRVLRSWYGGIAPEAVDTSPQLSAATSYAWRSYIVPPSPDSWSRDVVVAGICGFPKASDQPLVMGYGAGPDRRNALGKAEREALQLLAFLWGESVPASRPTLLPTALGHLEWWLYPGHHDLLHRWLDGEHAELGPCVVPDAPDGEVAYVDLTPAWLTKELHVVKAMCRSATPLRFGDAPMSSRVPETLRVHPIV